MSRHLQRDIEILHEQYYKAVFRADLLRRGITTKEAARAWAIQDQRDPDDVLTILATGKQFLRDHGTENPEDALDHAIIRLIANESTFAYFVRCALGLEPMPEDALLVSYIQIIAAELIEGPPLTILPPIEEEPLPF